MKNNKKSVIAILSVSLVFLLIIIGVSVFGKDTGKETEYKKVNATLPSESTTATTTSTTTTTTTIPDEETFYQYAKYRAPNAKPADIEKHGKILALVNNYNELPANFQWDLVYWSNGEAVDNSILNKSDFDIQAIDRIAYEPLKRMFEDAEKAGCPLEFYSGYRSIVRQNRNFVRSVENNVNSGLSLEEAKAKTNKSRAYPGTSEHNLGLAIDILAKGSTDLSNNFENTAQFKWLSENAENYGFILRYPEDKVEITGMIYQPWHWRYVGVDAATQMKNNNQCLEEYLGAI